MKIILSPAKKMREDTDSIEWEEFPALLNQAQVMLKRLQSMSEQELQELWKCNSKIAQENVKRLETMDLKTRLTPAILAYDGIAFQHMAPRVFESAHFSYVQHHLRILSGFYGVLKPLDGVRPYRLEMQAPLKLGTYKNLYEYWGNILYKQVSDEDGVILNLASKEYAKCIEPFLTSKNRYITCVFAEMSKGRMVQKGTFAKMARGEMVRYMAERQIENPEDIKQFHGLGYQFREDLSNKTQYVFERKKESKTDSADF